MRNIVMTKAVSVSGRPPGATVHLRAGWSLGPVQSRYILEGEGGDQVCGRAATGPRYVAVYK